MIKEKKTMACIGVGTRHTAAVGCIAISQTNARFFVSVSKDCCLKLWDLPEKLDITGIVFIYF